MKSTLLLIATLCVAPFLLSAQIDSTLFESIKTNNLKKVDSLITAGVDLDATDEHGANALMWACYHADSAMVAMMFDRGAEPPKKGGGIYYEGEDRLGLLYKGWYGDLQSVAAGENKVETLKYLIRGKKMNINIQTSHPSNDTFSLWTPLMHAGLKESITAFNFFSSQTINKSLKNKLGKTAIEISRDNLIKKYFETGKAETIDSLIKINKFEEEKLKLFYSGKFKEALAIAEIHLDMVKRNYGLTHPFAGSALSDIATFNDELGNHDEALPYAKKAYEIIYSSLGPDYRYLGLYLNNLANTYGHLGMLSEALRTFYKARDADVRNLGSNHQFYGLTLNNLSLLHVKLSEYDLALPLSEEAHEIAENILTSNHPHYANSLVTTGGINQRLGNYKVAFDYYSRALENIAKIYGTSHPDYLLLIHNIGNLHFLTKNFDEAKKYMKMAEEKRAKILGENHPNYGATLYNLGMLYNELDDFEKANEVFNKTRNIYKEVFGATHLNFCEVSINLGKIKQIEKNKKEADKIYGEALNALNFNLLNQYNYLPERSQLNWKSMLEDIRTTLNSFYLSEIPNELFKCNIQMKNASVYENKRSNDLKFNEWNILKGRIGRELSKPIEKRNKNLKGLQEKAYAIETQLVSNKKVKGAKLINIEEVKHYISKSELVIDITHFNYYNPEQTDTILYTASILRKDVDTIQNILLFTEAELKAAMNTPNENTGSEYRLATRGVIVNKKGSGKDLSMVWEKLLPHLEGYKTIYFSPSGLLSTINLGAIEIENGITIADKYDLKIYNNIKSLLEKVPQYQKKDYLLAGGIRYTPYPNQFDKILESDIDTLEQYLQKDIIATRAETRNGWEYLPGTKKEIDKIEKSLSKAGFSEGHKLEQYGATEEKVKELLSKETSPRIVHFSTHGFFFPDLEHNADDNRTAFKSSENPMIRSGILLSGANHAWKGNIVPDDKEDGILTAYEIQNLNLEDTELVVLSACETGLGEINGSEGVFGLQRAFKIAGAKHLIMSLWEVPDKHTQKLMTKFYKKWLQEGMELRAAFYAAQAEMRRRYKDPYLWAGFILVE